MFSYRMRLKNLPTRVEAKMNRSAYWRNITKMCSASATRWTLTVCECRVTSKIVYANVARRR
jgi:hypothetical protein